MIRAARPDEMDAIRELLREYAEVVGSPICFESFAREMAELPGSTRPCCWHLYRANRPVVLPFGRSATELER